MNTASPHLDEQTFAATLRAHGILSVAFFGSYARGEATSQSDLDGYICQKRKNLS